MLSLKATLLTKEDERTIERNLLIKVSSNAFLLNMAIKK
jgi:hypothetical protein